jgi:hypothetical protein
MFQDPSAVREGDSCNASVLRGVSWTSQIAEACNLRSRYKISLGPLVFAQSGAATPVAGCSAGVLDFRAGFLLHGVDLGKDSGCRLTDVVVRSLI